MVGMAELAREHDALSIRLRLVEKDISDLHDEKDVPPLPMGWAARTYHD